jgi:SAM-dependent methyltransferase
MTVELTHLFKIARTSLDERGVLGTVKHGPHYLKTYLKRRKAWRTFEEQDGFDRQHGTDTTAMLGPADFGHTSENVRYASLYRATLPRTFNRIIRAMRIRHEDFIFVDFGSGKGRTLLLASEFPFKRVIGVEFSPALHEIAQKNVGIYQSKTQKCKEFKLECSDAAAYKLPIENTVFYLCDPFELPVMNPVIDNLKKSLENHPRKVFIAYLNPTYCAAMENSGFLHRIAKFEGGPPEAGLEYPWHIYTNKL